MPRSDSDVTENASLTSDEQIGLKSPVDGYVPQPPLTNTQSASSPDAAASPDIPSRPAPGPGATMFQQSALKIIQMQKHTLPFQLAPQSPGDEPGIDPRLPSTVAQYSHLHETCKIEVVDYGETRATFRKLRNKTFIEFLESDQSARQPWAKVRWINIGGVSWDVMSALAIKYGLHPLSIEDVFTTRRTSQSKADYYPKHLFVSTLCHTIRPIDLHPDTEHTVITSEHNKQEPTYLLQRTTSLANTPGGRLPEPVTTPQDSHRNWIQRHFSSNSTKAPEKRGPLRDAGLDHKISPEDEDNDDGIDWIRDRIELEEEAEKARQRLAGLNGTGHSQGRIHKGTLEKVKAITDRLTVEGQEHAANLALLDELKRAGRVEVKIRNLYIFLLRDGTLISIYHDDSPTMFGKPLVRRLHKEQTLLRTSADASLLLQGLLDYVVDSAMEIVDRYHNKILSLEREILIKPKMKTVRELHILSGDLVLHKRTMTPIKSLVYGLRRYDLDRCAALLGSVAPNKDMGQVIGFMSHQSKVYLADVHDHMEYILSSLDMFAGIAENLISFTFNTISYQTNETMRRLSLATILFLPLTFLTGYFGMNFVRFTGVNNHSDGYFWIITAPVMVVTILIFMWHDLERIGNFLGKKLLHHRIRQENKT